MEARPIVSPEEASDPLHRSMMEEFQQHRADPPIAIAYDRRPG